MHHKFNNRPLQSMQLSVTDAVTMTSRRPSTRASPQSIACHRTDSQPYTAIPLLGLLWSCVTAWRVTCPRRQPRPKICCVSRPHYGAGLQQQLRSMDWIAFGLKSRVFSGLGVGGSRSVSISVIGFELNLAKMAIRPAMTRLPEQTLRSGRDCI